MGFDSNGIPVITLVDRNRRTIWSLVKLDTQVKIVTLRYESLEVMALLKEGVEAATHRHNAALARLKQHEATDQTRSSSRVLEFKIPQRPAAGTLTKTWNQNLHR